MSKDYSLSSYKRLNAVVIIALALLICDIQRIASGRFDRSKKERKQGEGEKLILEIQ